MVVAGGQVAQPLTAPGIRPSHRLSRSKDSRCPKLHLDLKPWRKMLLYTAMTITMTMMIMHGVNCASSRTTQCKPATVRWYRYHSNSFSCYASENSIPRSRSRLVGAAPCAIRSWRQHNNTQCRKKPPH